MAFYGSIFPANGWVSRPMRHARHIACPQRLKYIHNINDGYIPYVEDSEYKKPSSQKSNHLSLCNTGDIWRQELMGLAQQIQSSLHLQSFDDLRQSRSPRSRRTSSSKTSSHSEDNISKRLLTRRTTARYPHSYLPKPRIAINENEQESSTNTKNQDPGIWLLPILCHTLQVDNIDEAQEWLLNANPTEKRLAMELISRTMQDMQHHDNDETSICDQSSTSLSSFNNLYWPYKFWQHQQQPKISIDNNDTCERATSPVRILTPARRLATPAVSTRSNQSSNSTRYSSSRLSTPLIANDNDRLSRRGYRVTTSRSTSTTNDLKSSSTNFRGKTPLI